MGCRLKKSIYGLNKRQDSGTLSLTGSLRNLALLKTK
jgi:hypothetical protein